MPALGRQIGFCQRQSFLQVRYVFLENRQLLAFFFVADQHRRPIRGSHSQQIVQIAFIRCQDQVELRLLHIQPRQIARVVIVIQQCVRPQIQELHKRRIVAQLSGLSQILCRRFQKFRKCQVIRHSRHLVFVAQQDGMLVINLRSLFGVRRNVFFDLSLR